MPFVKGMFGRTVLGEAIGRRDKEAILKLIKMGHNPNEKAIDDLVGYTPLMIELSQNRPDNEILMALISAGANPELKDNMHRTAFDYAKTKRQKEILESYRPTKKEKIKQPENPAFYPDKWFVPTPECLETIEKFTAERERQFNLLTPEQQKLVKHHEAVEGITSSLLLLFVLLFIILIVLCELRII